MHLSDSEPLQDTIDALSDPKHLSQLRGFSRRLDAVLSLVGDAAVSEILSTRLRQVLDRDSRLGARARQLTAVTFGDNARVSDRSAQQELADWLGTTISGNDELRGEISHVLWKALQTGRAEALREGKPDIWGERSREELFVREYASVEAEVFARFKEKVCSSASSLVPHELADNRATWQQSAHGEPTATCAESGSVTVPSDSDAKPKVSSWPGMQRMAQLLDWSDLSEAWKREPRRSFLWLMQNGVEEQMFEYLYQHAGEFDAELRNTLVEALESDEGEIPIVWRTVLTRALTRTDK